MKRIQLTKTEWIKLILAVMVITVLIAMAGIYMGSRGISKTTEKMVASIQKGANISIAEVHHRAVQDGVEQWRLDAEKAHYMQQKKQAVFDNVTVVFFLDGGGEVHLSADSGILHTGSNNIEVSGNVVMVGNAYKLETEKLQYDHNGRKITSDRSVAIEQNESRLVADSMIYYMDDDRLILEGQVHGAFEQKLLL